MTRRNPKPDKHPFTAAHRHTIRTAALRMKAATHVIATHDDAHATHRTLDEDVLYPPHAERVETSAYSSVHHDLVHNRKLPCMVCGVTVDTLSDPAKNPFGATALETHHHAVEWALSNAIDVEKFNERVVRIAHARNPSDPKYCDPRDRSQPRRFTRDEMIAWIDHDPDNLWVLCDVHHRHRSVGIHMITGPIWGAQDLLMAQYQAGTSAGSSKKRAKAPAAEQPEEAHDEASTSFSAPTGELHPTEIEAAEAMFAGILRGLFGK